MLRFIYICMGVVALSILSIALQPVMNGVEAARDQIAARNKGATETESAIAVMDTETEELSPESLNAIETAAGADTEMPDTGFGESFTHQAPKGLEDTPIMVEPAAEQIPTF